MATRAFSGFGKQLNRVEGRQVVRAHALEDAPLGNGWHVPTMGHQWTSPAKSDLVQLAADAIRVMRSSAEGLTSKEHDRLKQLSHGQYLTGVLSLVEISQKCRDLWAATAFPEALRGYQVQHHPSAKPQWFDAFHAENLSNSAFDDAQVTFAAFPTEANRQRAIEAAQMQLAETYRALNALHAGRRS